VLAVRPKDLTRRILQDPFETPYNVARTVTKDGLYTVSKSKRFDAETLAKP
jgi:hypothetical protein